VNGDPDFFRRLREQQEWVRRLTEGPDFLRRIREQQERTRQLTEGPDFLRRIREQQERTRQLTEGPDFLRRIREQQERTRQLTEGPDFLRRIREQQEQIRRLTEAPEFNLRFQETLDELRSPVGLSELASELESAESAAGAVVDSSLDHEAQADQALGELRAALEEWNADAGGAAAFAAGSDSEAAFGWIDVLPTVVQLKLLLSTLDVLNGLLLVVGYLSPASVPMAVVLVAEALIRLNRALLERLNNDRPPTA
jgi:vacuolar-type H+-ATPase subunit I/STV1